MKDSELLPNLKDVKC